MNKSSIGGTLSIVSGVLGILMAISIILFGVVLMNEISNTVSTAEAEPIRFIMGFYTIFGAFVLLPSILAIVGGIFAIKKKYWGWALAGAIAASISFYWTGIAAVILIAMAHTEFPKALKADAQ